MSCILAYMNLRLILSTILAALLAALAQPNELFLQGLPWLAFVMYTPWFWALSRTRSNRQAAGLGALFMLVTSPLQYFWLAFFGDFSVWTIGGVTLALTGYGALLGPVLRQAGRWDQGRWAPWTWALVITAFEWLRSNGFLAFPWGLSAYPLHEWTVLLQSADLGGTGILAFLITAVNGSLVRAGGPWMPPQPQPPARPVWGRELGFIAALWSLNIAYGLWTFAQPLQEEGRFSAALIQNNADPWSRNGWPDALAQGVALSVEALEDPKPDLIVWTETSLRVSWAEQAYFERNPPGRPLAPLVRESGTHWLFGTPLALDAEQRRWVNGTVLARPGNPRVDWYGKRQLVPFAELIPFYDNPAVKEFFTRALNLQATWAVGPRWTTYELPTSTGTVRFGTPICFEDAFPSVTRAQLAEGAQLWIVVTNDSWSRRDSSQIQHHVVAKFRSIESKRVMVRAANSGVTGVIGPWGQALAGPLPSFSPAVLKAEIPVLAPAVPTVYTRWGDWFSFLAMASLTWLLVWRRRRPD